MTKEQIETILWKLKDVEWRFNRVDNGPDEYVCPDLCTEYCYKGVHPSVKLHSKPCGFKEVLDLLEEELEKLNIIEDK